MTAETALQKEGEDAEERSGYTPTELASLQQTYRDGFARLRFPEPWEDIFRSEYTLKSITQARIAAVLGIVLYMLFGFRDMFFASEVITTVWIIRYGIVMPILILVLVLSFVRVMQPHILKLTMAAILAVGFGVFAVSAVMSRPLNSMIDTGLIPILVYACTVSRMRFLQATCCGLTLFVMHQMFAFNSGANAPFFMGSEPYQVHQAFSFLIFIVILISLFACYMLEYRVRENFVQQKLLESDRNNLQGLTKTLQQLSSTDSLTGMYNRRHFNQCLNAEWGRCQRDHRPLSLILLDIDFFKPFNDNYGHQAGDEVLKQVGRALKDVAKRGGEVAARYGGEEFILLYPEVDREGLEKIADKVNAVVREIGIKHEYSRAEDVVTCSVGGISLIPSQDYTPEQVIEEADKCLYQAKESGRNRYVITEL